MPAVLAPQILLLLSVGLACSEPGALGIAGPSSGGLVFVIEQSGQADLARARLSDGAVVRIAQTPQREERWPYWSDIARRVVFQARPYGSDPRTDLYLWDPESGSEVHLTPTRRRDERWPVWSPVAPAFAYAFRGEDRRSGIAIYELPAGRTRIAVQRRYPESFLRPEFSPDGDRLVVQRRVGRNPVSHLWLIENAAAPRRLTQGPFFDTKPFFTPDGREIVFTRRREPHAPGDIWMLDLATNALRSLASLPDADDHSAKHSPTRRELVLVSDRDGNADVFLFPLPDGPARNITRTPDVNEGAPQWSSDGERLSVLLRPGGPSDPGEPTRPDEVLRIGVIDREGRLLFETQGQMADWMPAWP